MKDDLEKLNETLRADLEDYNPTLAEMECYYSLKEYIDARFKLLEEKLKKGT